MCLYYHDTGKHRENDENYCCSFERKSQNRVGKDWHGLKDEYI